MATTPAATSNAETSWNVTLTDTSPLFQYTPFADGSNPQLAGWQNVYSEGSTVTPGNERWLLGDGISQHVTGAAAQVSLSFHGTGIFLKGGVTGNMKYTIDLDGQISTPTADGTWLAIFKGLANDVEHKLTLYTQPQAQGDWLAIQEAVVQVGSGFSGATMTPIREEEVGSGWQWSPGFTQVTDTSTGKQMVLARSVRAGDWGALTFTGHSVILHGPTNVNHGRYAVTLDGKTEVFNATSRHLVPDVVLYQAAGLDPTKQHTLNITHLDSNPFEVDYATILNVQGGVPYNPSAANVTPTIASTPNIPLIVGAIGGGVALLLIAGLAWFFLRRRRNQKASSDGERGLPSDSEMAAAGNTSVSVIPPTLPPIAAAAEPAPIAPRVRFMEELNRVETTSSIISDTDLPPVSYADGIDRTNTPPAGFMPPSILIRRVDTLDSQNSDAPLVRPPIPAPNVPRIFLTQPGPAVVKQSAWSGDSASLSSAYDSRPSSYDNDSLATARGTLGSRHSQEEQSLPNPFDDGNAAFAPPSARGPGSTISRPSTPQAAWELPIPKPEGVINSDLLAALESTSVPSVSRSGTRKVGLPSNPRSYRDLSQP